MGIGEEEKQNRLKTERFIELQKPEEKKIRLNGALLVRDWDPHASESAFTPQPMLKLSVPSGNKGYIPKWENRI